MGTSGVGGSDRISIQCEERCHRESWVPPYSTVQSLGREDPLEKGMATHFSILAWKLPDRGAWWATVHGITKSRT